MATASLMFFAFLGFESISMAVDEIKEPQKCSTRNCAIFVHCNGTLYIGDTGSTGIDYYSKLDVADAVAFALRSVGLSWAAKLCVSGGYFDFDYCLHL